MLRQKTYDYTTLPQVNREFESRLKFCVFKAHTDEVCRG